MCSFRRACSISWKFIRQSTYHDPTNSCSQVPKIRVCWLTNASVVAGIPADVMLNRYRPQSSSNVLLQTCQLPATTDKACGKAEY